MTDIMVRKELNAYVRLAASGSFDSGAHDKAVSTSAQDDGVWVGWREGVVGWGG